MRIRRRAFERIHDAIEETDAEQPLTAREILELLDDEEFDSAHQIATVLGREADVGGVEVIEGQPYRYRFDTDAS
ncbi:MAG: hypothetical protein PPP58_02940 [Natronomonas sp.]